MRFRLRPRRIRDRRSSICRHLKDAVARLNMQCLICGAEAQDLTPGDLDGLMVRCKRCGEYEVAGSALNGLLRLGFNERVDALKKAKKFAQPGARPAISTSCL